MRRLTKDCGLLKSDFDKEIVKKVSYDNHLEYWIYTPTDTENVLKKIVLCEDKPDHIVYDCPTHFCVRGVIVDNTDTLDLNDYLNETGRSI